MKPLAPLLAHDRPGAVGLTAGSPTRLLRAALDVDGLAIVRAAEARRVVVVVDDAKFPAMIVARIAPAINGVGASGIEAIIIGLVRVTAIFAVQVAGQCGAHRPADDHARKGRASTPATASGSVPKKAADQPSDDNPGWIGRIAALLVIDVVVIGIGSRIAFAPKVIAVIPVNGLHNDPGRNQREEEVVIVVAHPTVVARRLSQAVLLPIADDILILPVL